MQADHRSIYIDFHANKLVGGNQHDMIAAFKNRQFQSTNPEECRKYLKAVKKYWRIHKIVARIDALEGLSAKREDIQAEWEKLDCDIGRAMIIGKKAVRKPVRKQSWSKQLRKAAYHHQYWKRRYKMCKYGIDEDEVMEELHLTAGILPTEKCICCSREILLSKCRTSKTKLRLCKNN